MAGFKAVAAKLLASAVGKTAVVSVASVTAGAVAAGAVTTTSYTHKINTYKEKGMLITEEDVLAERAARESKEAELPTLNSLEGQTLRVFDGMVQVYTEEGWTDYATVDDIERQDPFYGTEERRAAVELTVLNEKLEEAGITLNEEGEFVPIEEVNIDGTEKTEGAKTFNVGSILVEKTAESVSGNKTVKNGKAQENASATVVIDPATKAALDALKAVNPQQAAVLQQAITNANTAQVAQATSGGGDTSNWSSGSSGDSGSSWSSGSSGGSSSGGSYSAPSGGDSGGSSYSPPPSSDSGGGSSDSGSSDSGSSDSGSSDSGSSDSGSSDSGSSDSGGDGEDFGGDAW